MADYSGVVFLTPTMAAPYEPVANDQGAHDFNDVVFITSSGGGGGGGGVTYLNRVSDSVAGKFVSWPTVVIDDTGIEYPGPGTFGVDTSDYSYSRLS